MGQQPVNNKTIYSFNGQDSLPCPCFLFTIIEKAPFPSGFGAFSFVANEEAGQSQSAVTLPGRSRLVELADSELETPLCDRQNYLKTPACFEVNERAGSYIWQSMGFYEQGKHTMF
jgi:hypothetical protein